MLLMHPVLADEHIRDLHDAAARYRLNALARADKPTLWRRAATRAQAVRTLLATWVRRSQLGPTPNYCATC